MASNKRQRVGIAILAVGLAALIVDRGFVLPRSAPAGPADFVDQYTIQRPQNAPTPTPHGRPATPAVCDKLARAWSENHLDMDSPRDPFLLPTSWRQEAGSEAENNARTTAAAAFIETHKLDAVVIDAMGKRVLVDGSLFQLGDELDGFRLVAIDRESTVFQDAQESVELKLAEAQ